MPTKGGNGFNESSSTVEKATEVNHEVAYNVISDNPLTCAHQRKRLFDFLNTSPIRRFLQLGIDIKSHCQCVAAV